MASPRDHLVSYKGCVVEFCVEVENTLEGIELEARVFKMDKTTGRFDLVWVVGSSDLGPFNIITAKCVCEESTGSILPCVLLHNCKGKSGSSCVFQAAFLILDGKESRFQPCQRMSTSHNLCHSDVLKTFQLLSGPRLAYRYHGDLFVASDKQNTGSFQQLKIATSTFDPLWWGKLGRTLIAMGTEACSASPDHQMETDEEMVPDLDLIWGHKWMYVAMETKDEEWKKRDGSVFIPHPYACVARAMYLLEYRLIRQTIDGDNPEQEDADVHQSHVLLATNQGQLVELEDGEVRRICELPFPDPSDVRVAYVSGGETLVLVTSSMGGVCAVWGSNFKPAGHWPTAHTVLTDYFLSRGSQQVLLLSGSGGVFDGFLLTDLMGYNITDQQEEAEEETDVSTSTDRNVPMQSAVQALEARLYESQASLEELRSLSAQKDRVIQQTCTALRDMVLQSGHITGQATLPEDPSLVCLYNGKGVPLSPDQTPPSPPMSDPITVVRVWQRLVLDQWVVGLEISNQSDITLQDVCLALVRYEGAEAGATKTSRWNSDSTSSCRVVPSIPPEGKPGSETSHFQSKKLKMDNSDTRKSNTTLVCVCPLPKFGAHPSVQCSLLLSWREREGTGKDSEVDSSIRDVCLDVGHVKLSIGDITNRHLTVFSGDGSKTDDKQKIDLLALEAVQSETRLKVRCSHGNLRQLPQMLQSTLGFQAIPGTPGLFCKRQGPLQYVRVTCTVISRAEAELSVCTRDLPQLSLLLHSLYSLLPRGTKVLPDLQDTHVKEEVEKYVKSEQPHIGSKLKALLQGKVIEKE
ncbi:Fanconi anemia group B protein-like [Branchiostoma floridae x Branchiostoma japonicum]